MRCCGIHLIAISQKLLQIYLSLKWVWNLQIYRLQSNPPGAYELNGWLDMDRTEWSHWCSMVTWYDLLSNCTELLPNQPSVIISDISAGIILCMHPANERQRYTVTVNRVKWISWMCWKSWYNLNKQSKTNIVQILTHWGLVTPFGDINPGQHWLR